ncbi:FHA domain-containing protein [Oscillochloris sp. ZM17-4]|uniref:FHA domain-containing protein n=1 Tax=Oscillochloris sp. ZM17-4 TaxID=2866714 RepID=UPI001C72BC00|nr:FHA domain-containing protein [Oscillochloris sp. ZM17-4]MBX0331263.1 FHA domain-containing protein [Oscillochloris sp. ZM17-4]
MTSFSALEHDLDGEQAAPIGVSPLRLDVLGPQGETLRSLDLTEPVLTIGQASGNQLVLDAEGVSRYHMRLSRDGARVMVADLGGRTGTTLNDQRLVPHTETPMAPGGFLRVGPFRLRLSDPAAARAATTAVVAPDAVHSAIVLSIAGGRETLELTPGQPAVVVFMLTNNGDAPDAAVLSAEGIPPEWMRLPEGAVR